jgi:GNAT superfamily N-acetyltransferase
MSDDAIDIRRASDADVAILARHRVSMFRDMKSVAPAAEAALHESAAAHLREAMATGEYVAWLAHPVGQPQSIVGGAGVQLRRLLPRPDDAGNRVLTGREAVVLNVYVERDHRRRGVARRLMETVLAWAARAGVARLVLHPSDEGRPLYEALGFVPTNEMRYTGSLTP